MHYFHDTDMGEGARPPSHAGRLDPGTTHGEDPGLVRVEDGEAGSDGVGSHPKGGVGTAGGRPRSLS